MVPNNVRPLRILVSHSGRQYVHQLLKGLIDAGHEVEFVTSFAYKPSSLPFKFTKILPTFLKRIVEKELRKRIFEGIPDENIRQNAWFEILREASDKIFRGKYSERMLFIRDRRHDHWVASLLKKTGQYDIVISYEECSMETFRKAKILQIKTVLDLAQIHYKQITHISSRFPVFSQIYKNKDLRRKINEVKEEEILLSDHIICLSEFAKKSLVENGIPIEKIFIAHLGFDPQKFQPKKVYNSDGPLKLVFAGTITKRKGVDLLLDLKKELGNEIELTFIGPMADARDLLEKNKGNYKWLAYLDQNEMNKIFQLSDVFVFPSYLDSWAMVVLEAMACGLPVIVSDNTGAKDAVKEGCGFIIPNGDIQLLKEKVKFFLHNKNQLSIYGMNALKSAQHFTWKNYYAQIEKIMEEIKFN